MAGGTWRDKLARLDPLRAWSRARRRRVLREHVLPLHGVLAEVQAHYVHAYQALLTEIVAQPRFASARIIESVRDDRRHLKTYQLLLPEAESDALDTWVAMSSRLEMLGHALTWSSRAFRVARDQLAAVTRDATTPHARAADAYFQALTMYHTIRSRGSLVFRIYPERLGRGRADFRPGAELEPIVGAHRVPPAQVVTFLVHERTDETVTRDLRELVEGALFTKRANWKVVEERYRAMVRELEPAA